MFSSELMKYLINYKKTEYTPEETKKKIDFKDSNSGKLAEIYATINK